MSCTIVLSFCDTCKHRKKNLDFIVDSILTTSSLNVILSEQIKSKNDKKITATYGKRITHIKYNSSESFEKSFLYNLAAKNTESEYLFFLDADVVLPFKKIENKLQSDKFSDFIKPFRSIFTLNEIDSTSFLNKEPIDLSRSVSDTTVGKYAFIIRSSLFRKVGGFDESFKGWGWEDIDFVKNKLKLLDCDIMDDTLGVHLFHSPASRSEERANHFIFQQNSNSNKIISFSIDLRPLETINPFSLLQRCRSLYPFYKSVDLLILLGENQQLDYKNFYSRINKSYKDLVTFVKSSEVYTFKTSLETSVKFSQGNLHCRIFENSLLNNQSIQEIMSTPFHKNNIISEKNQLLFLSKLIFDYRSGLSDYSGDFSFESLCDFFRKDSTKYPPKNYRLQNSYGEAMSNLRYYDKSLNRFDPI